MIGRKFYAVLASILSIKLILDFDRKTIITVSTIAFIAAILSIVIYNGGIQQAMAHNPNSIPQVIAPTDGQIFTFDAAQGPSARIFVAATDPDAEDLVNIATTSLPPGASYEVLETDRQPSTGLIIFGDGFPLPGTYSITFTAVDFQIDEDGSPAPGHGATSLPVTITIIVKKTPKCFGVIPTILGSGDPDIIRGTPNNDVIFGGGGDDDIRGGGGNDLICGGHGNDTIRGGGGNDMLAGNFGDDLMYGWLGDDSIFGDLGDDTIDGGYGKDNCRGETITLCETRHTRELDS